MENEFDNSYFFDSFIRNMYIINSKCINNKKENSTLIFTKSAVLSLPIQNRTENLPLGGACYLHLTMGSYWFF